MAKKSMINKNERRIKLSKQYEGRRSRLKALAVDSSVTPEDQFAARLKLAALPRNANPTRIRNRCSITGRPHAYYRKFGICRVKLREMASLGLLPGVTKASW